MTEAIKPTPSPLPAELQRQLNFEFTTSKEWLINEEFTQIGGVEHYEFLPARARVSADGTRYEIGTRRVDIEGVLELAKIVRPDGVQSADTVVNFWQNHPKFSSIAEGDHIFIGANIEPTLEGFEAEASSVGFAFDVALESAMSGRTFEELKQDERWYGSLLQQIENPSYGRTIFFNTEPEELRDDLESHSGGSCEITPPVTVDTLKEYPLRAIWHGLHNAPGKVSIEGRGERKFVNGSWVVIQPGNSEVLDGSRTVQISIPESRRASFDDDRPQDDLTVYLQIPEGEEIQTVGDIAKLKRAEVFAGVDDEEGQVSRRTDIVVTVEDDSFKIVSVDGGFSVELRKPCCPECQKPTWKWPSGEGVGKSWDSMPEDWDDNTFLYGESFGGGEPPKFHPFFERAEGGEEISYCGDCIDTVVDRYKTENPFASRTNVVELARQKLDEADYQDVEITKGQVWNMNGEWDVMTNIEYERDGRKIWRYTGELRISHEGGIKLNMLPREYVAFRYKAE